MRKQLTKELDAVFAALVVHDARSFSFAGSLQQVNGAAPPLVSTEDPLTAALQTTFYQHAYSNRFDGRLAKTPDPSTPAEDITPDLSKANASLDRWETGWLVLQVLPSGQVAAQRHGVTRLLWAGEFLTVDGGALRPGARLNLFWKRESSTWQPGFYYAVGETVADHQDESRFVRLYWHVRVSAAATLLKHVTSELNRFQIPFRFKLLCDSRWYGRADAAVLYVARRHFRLTSELLAVVHSKMTNDLERDTPLFAKPLAPGLGLAEDPGTGESFGMHRCRLVAEAVVTAFREGSQTSQARWRALGKRFQDAGLSLDKPYLNPASTDEYPWPTI